MQLNEYHCPQSQIIVLQTEQRFSTLFIQQLVQQSSQVDQQFLISLSQWLDQKQTLSSRQITEVSIVLIMISKSETKKLKGALKNMQQIQKQMNFTSNLSGTKSQNIQWMGWISKIWDRLLHFTTFRHFSQILTLYFHIRPYLLSPEDQFKRVQKLLIQTVVKQKIIASNILNFTTSLLIYFLDFFQKHSSSSQVKAKLKFIAFFFFAKMQSFQQKHILVIKKLLLQINRVQLWILIECLHRIEQNNVLTKQEENYWDLLFESLLKTINCEQISPIVSLILQHMISFRLDMQTVKLLIRHLEISAQQKPVVKWKNIFNLIKTALNVYDIPRNFIVFQNQKSFYKHNFITKPPFFLHIGLKFSMRDFNQQKMLFRIQDQNKNKELWITIRHINQGQALLIFLKVEKGVIFEKQQRCIPWKRCSTIFCFRFLQNQIEVNLDGIQQSRMKYQKFIQNPLNLVIGDQLGDFGTSIKALLSITTSQSCIKQQGICSKLSLQNTYGNQFLKAKQCPSFIQLIRAVGDLDIFLLIISHAVKKLKKNQAIVELIRIAINLLDGFVLVKQVKHVQLKKQQRQQRLSAVLCLSWQCSHITSNPLTILQLLRIIGIRGVSYAQDQLQILCNFVFWKHFQWQYQKLLIMKIKQLFSQLHLQANSGEFIQKYCKRLLIQTALFYRLEDYCLCEAQIKDNILRIHYQFLDLIRGQLIDILKIKKDVQTYKNYVCFALKLVAWNINRRKDHYNLFDLTLGLQIVAILNKTSVEIQEWNGTDENLLDMFSLTMNLVELYQQQKQFYNQKPIKVFNKGQGSNFTEFQHEQIKKNLLCLAFNLVTLRQKVFIKIIKTQGYEELKSMIWTSCFFEKYFLMNQKDLLIKQNKTQEIEKIKFLKQKLPLEVLTKQQLVLLIRIYINNDLVFPQFNQKLCNIFRQNIQIQQAFYIVLAELKKIVNGDSQITKQASTITVQTQMNLKSSKIITLISAGKKISSLQGFELLQYLARINHTEQNKEKAKLLCYFFAIKGLLENSKQILEENPQSSIFVSSLSQIKTQSFDSIQRSKHFSTLNRALLIASLEYYLMRINAKSISQIMQKNSMQESQARFQSIKLNIQELMNIISSYNLQNIAKLKYYHSFLESQLLIISEYFVNQELSFKENFMAQSRKRSIDSIDLKKIQLQEQAQKLYMDFVEQRNQFFENVQKHWIKLEQKNKYFWSTFIAKQTYFSLFQGTNSFNEPYLLKKDKNKPKLDLPILRIIGSYVKSNSIVSQRGGLEDDESQSNSSIFDDAPLYRKQKQSKNSQNALNKESRLNKFKVLLITPVKIYQGTVDVNSESIKFVQNTQINEEIYYKISASNCEKRTNEQARKQNFSFRQQLSPKCIAIAKRYLFHDIAVQVHINNRSYFFTFFKKDHRLAFLMLLEKHIMVLSRQKMSEEIKRLKQRWQNGFISNFAYLMKINDITGRSFNDISQYYVFPWTVKNFNQEIDIKFISSAQNFRDLKVPVGKICPKKWGQIKKRFQISQKQNQLPIPNFLFGSFYSYPAIVSNYLIRINPFAFHHYELQSNHFDLADRLFHSVQNSYQSLIETKADFKELIPQFYCFPDFLNNKSSYNLGKKQNKDLVFDVKLPVWAKDAHQFIFRMRKLLESQIVSYKLHFWIDLVFGVYANWEHALKADNLFLKDFYIDGFQRYLLKRDKYMILSFKQLGQVPVPIFEINHFPIKFARNFIDSIKDSSMYVSAYSINHVNQGKILQICYYKKFTILLFQRQLRVYQEQKFSQKEYFFVNGDFQGGSMRSWQLTDVQDKKHYCLVVHRAKTNDLAVYEIKKGIFGAYSLQGGAILPFLHRCQNFCLYETFIICTCGKNTYIYQQVKSILQQQFSKNSRCLILDLNKNKYLFQIFSQFVQHKSRITHTGCTDRGIVITLDDRGCVFVLEIRNNNIQLFNNFQIRSTYFEEKIVQMIPHQMALIIFRTNFGRILLYTFLGEELMAKSLQFPKKSQSSNVFAQKALSLTIWNNQLSQVLVGTTSGNLWKIDMFAMRKNDMLNQDGLWIEKLSLNKEGFRKQGLSKVSVRRIGRHSITLVFGQNSKLYAIRSQKWDEVRKIELLGKKMVPLW